MKKILFVLAVLMFAAPALAAVDITCSDEGDGVIAIYYDAVTEGNSVRAFALDIRADDANITDVNDEVNSDFWVFPGTIQIVDGVVTVVGTAKAPGGDAGSCSGDSNCATIEMATLYVGANEPPDQALLLKITVDGDTCITITENSTRGEVVSESIVDNPAYDVTVNAPSGSEFCTLPPGCACAGDLDGDGYVAFSDVSEMVSDMIACGWFCMPDTPCWEVCDDFDEDGYMAFSDVSALVSYMIANSWFVICP